LSVGPGAVNTGARQPISLHCIRLKFGPLANHSHFAFIAQHYVLSAAGSQMKSTFLDFSEQQLLGRAFVHVRNGSSDYATIIDGLGAEQLIDPWLAAANACHRAPP
jgi:hypothetical protein